MHPDNVSFSCKDAIDIGMPATIELFLLLKLINIRPLSAEEEDYLKVILYYPSIGYRGRLLFPERFGRMNSMTKAIEVAIEDSGVHDFQSNVHKTIGPLFKHETLTSQITIPQPLF